MEQQEMSKEELQHVAAFRGAEQSPLYQAIVAELDEAIEQSSMKLGEPKVQSNHGVLAARAGGFSDLLELRGTLHELVERAKLVVKS